MPITGAEPAPLPERIETDRLLLRPVQPSDAAEIERLLADWEVVRYTARIPHPYEPGMAEAWIAALGSSTAEVVYAIEAKAHGCLIGCIGLEPNRVARVAELGFWVGKPYWRQGFATEAIAALVDCAFGSGDFDAIEAGAFVENTASIRLQHRLGFALVGIEERSAPARGGPRPMQVRRLRKADHEQARGATPTPTLSRGAAEGATTRGSADTVPVVVVVAVALIDADGRVLLARRPEGKPMAGLWEFPGGKLHDGETPEGALIRELNEELDIDVTARCLAPFTFASHRYESFHLLMPLYVCRVWDGTVTAQEGQELAWVRPNRLIDYPMPPADKPLAAMLRDLL